MKYLGQHGAPPAGQAIRLLRVHSLRGADALQLAAAVVASEHQPRTLASSRLTIDCARAALREGFAVLPAPIPQTT